MESITEVIKRINDHTDSLYEGLCDGDKKEVAIAVSELINILNKIKNENN